MQGAYQPKTGAPCSCRAGVGRDNCPQCEGTGMAIDFAAIRARATVADTPEAIRAFMLLALKGALKLESLGLKRRGMSALSVARQQFPGIVTARTAAAALPQYVAQLQKMGVLK